MHDKLSVQPGPIHGCHAILLFCHNGSRVTPWTCNAYKCSGPRSARNSGACQFSGRRKCLQRHRLQKQCRELQRLRIVPVSALYGRVAPCIAMLGNAWPSEMLCTRKSGVWTAVFRNVLPGICVLNLLRMAALRNQYSVPECRYWPPVRF